MSATNDLAAIDRVVAALADALARVAALLVGSEVIQ